MIYLVIVVSLIAMLSIATAYDLKWKYIPDYASYSFISIALAERVLYFLEQGDASLLTNIVPAVIILGGIGYLLYKSGMWGGGDLKVLISVAILLAGFKGELIPSFIDFFLNLMIIGALYILPVTLFIGLRKIKPSKKEMALMISSGIAGVIIIALRPSLSTAMISTGTFIAASIPYVQKVEEKCFVKPANMKTLMDGDWLVNEVKVGKRVIRPKREGLTYEEAMLIKKWWKQGKLKKKPLIKEGIAYLPAFLIASLVTLLFGNLMILMVAEGMSNSARIVAMLS